MLVDVEYDQVVKDKIMGKSTRITNFKSDKTVLVTKTKVGWMMCDTGF